MIIGRICKAILVFAILAGSGGMLMYGLASLAYAQSLQPAPDIQGPTLGRTLEIEVACPITPTIYATTDFWLYGMTISANSGISGTFTVQNAAGLKFADAIEIGTGATPPPRLYVVPLPMQGRLFTGGITVSCSTTGMVLYLKGWRR